MENALEVRESQGTAQAQQRAVPTTASTRIVELRPRLDVLENGESIRILADVPGVEAQHADVQIEMPHLRIACMRRTSEGAAIRYVASLTLPDIVDASSLSAALHDGVLEISMQKSERARARRIPVRVS